MFKPLLSNYDVYFLLILMLTLISCNTPIENKRSESYYAFLQQSQSQFSEDFKFETDYLIREYEIHNSLKNNFTSLRNTNPEFIGPYNITGRMLSLAINPSDTNILFAGSASGGLWRSDSAGRGSHGWKHVPLGYPVNAISVIAINPYNPQTMYIGTGEVYSFTGTDGGLHDRVLRGSFGLGVLKSIDGGKTWTILKNLTSDFEGINKIVFHPKDSNAIYVGSSRGLYKSSDQGNTWKNILSDVYISDLQIHAEDSTVIIAAGGGHLSPEHNIFKSGDDGVHWRKMLSIGNDNQGKIMLCAYEKNKNLMLAILSDTFKTTHILRTKNKFENYSIASTKDIATYQGWYAKSMLMKTDDSTKIVAGGVDLFLDDAGYGNAFYNLQKDQLKYHVDFHDVISNPKDPKKLYFASDGGLYRSNNFCKSIFPIHDGLYTSQFYFGSVSAKEANHYLGGLQDNRSALLLPKETEWRNIHFGDGTSSAILSEFGQYLCASQNLNIYKTIDTGKIWTSILPRNLNACFVSQFIASRRDQKTIYAGGEDLLISRDQGLNWQTKKLNNTAGPINYIHEPSYPSDSLFFSTINTLDADVGLYCYNLKNEQFLQINNNLPHRTIRDIETHPYNKNIIYIALDGYGSKHLFVSENFGQVWKAIDKNLPNIPFYTVLLDPNHPEIIYAGTDFGLYVSKNKGESWESIPFGELDIVKIYDLHYSSIDNKIIIFTHGNGVYRMDALTPLISTNSKNNSVNKLKVYYANKEIFIESDLSISFDIYDHHGKKCLTLKSNEWHQLAHLPSGNYILISSNRSLNLQAKFIHY